MTTARQNGRVIVAGNVFDFSYVTVTDDNRAVFEDVMRTASLTMKLGDWASIEWFDKHGERMTA